MLPLRHIKLNFMTIRISSLFTVNKTEAFRRITGIWLSLPVVLLCLFNPQAGAQVASGYAFTSGTGTYTPISGGTVLGTATNDDNNFNALTIGYTFFYNGVGYTQVSVNSNGFLAMGATVSSSYVALSG